MKYNSVWYKNLIKPDYTPSHKTFSIMWKILYAMMFLSLAIIIFQENNVYKKIDYILFFAQLLVNIYWTTCFFKEHNLYKSFLVSIILIVLVAMTLSTFFLSSKLAGILLLPYFLWCSFATILSYKIFRLNKFK